MSAMGFRIDNPRGNNRVLVITRIKGDGEKIRVGEIRPGQSLMVDARECIIEEKALPVRLDLSQNADGSYSASLPT